MNGIAGKRVLITGPTSGIGRQIAIELGQLGAHLVLACRDEAKGRDVARAIAAEAKGGDVDVAGDVDVLQVDVSSRESVQAFVAAYTARHPPVDVLVNNAGTIQGERRESVDGIELTFATNVLGYHRVTSSLLNHFNTAGAPRIVVVASAFAGELDLADLEFRRRPYDGLLAYRQSKACDRLWSWVLARRLQPRGITVNAMTPGWVPDTELSRNLLPEVRQARARPGRTVTQGADTAVWLAASPDVAGVTARFYADRRETPCEFRDHDTEERLWRICEDFVSRTPR
jgi:NAD(P)-dependent dehydrogenase (short-subunit alcohol dehydrogenase family)